jgi:hypothetical protein
LGRTGEAFSPHRLLPAAQQLTLPFLFQLCNIYLRTWHSRQFVRALQMSNLRANEAELRSVMGWVGDLVEAGALVGGAAGLSTEEGKDLAASCREASEAVDFSRGWKVLLGDLLKAEEGA